MAQDIERELDIVDQKIEAARAALRALRPRLLAPWTDEQRAAKATVDALEAEREALVAPILAERRRQDADALAMDIARGGDGEGL